MSSKSPFTEDLPAEMISNYSLVDLALELTSANNTICSCANFMQCIIHYVHVECILNMCPVYIVHFYIYIKNSLHLIEVRGHVLCLFCC